MKLLRINPSDHVAVALTPLTSRESITVDSLNIVIQEPINAGHKVAVLSIKSGDSVLKYGHSIGHATSDVAVGQLVHTHNLKTGLDGVSEYSYKPNRNSLEKREPDMFLGYRRPNGKVGIRNEVWIVPTVGCVNSTAANLQRIAQPLIPKEVEGLYTFPHPYGCSQMSEDHENTCRALAGLINHPNAAAVLVLGLGCENNSVEEMMKFLGDYDKERIHFLVTQDCADEYESGLTALSELLNYAAKFERENISMSELIVGLKCGASDGFSGITANPLVGSFSDQLVAQGGSVILTEVPEMFGAETILMSRCRTPELFNSTVRMINDFKNYYIENGQNIYENPSPGNKAGGISTLEDKSLGCIQKGGTSDVVDVLNYGEPVKTKGLNLLTGPGNDLVSASAMTASGAHLVLFTTGRGTPFGAPVPTVKISSNTAIYEKKSAWIDFNAGFLTEGMSLEDLSSEFYNYIRALVSGDILAKNELHNAREFTIFKTGVTL